MKVDGSELSPGVREVAHTADLGIEVEARSLAELFHRAAAGTMALVRGEEREGVENREDEGRSVAGRIAGPTGGAADTGAPGVEERWFELEGEDVETLLVRWLRELLYLQEVEGFVYRKAEFDELQGRSLRARVRGVRQPSPAVRELKGVTYHGLEVSRKDGGWQARVIFDI